MRGEKFQSKERVYGILWSTGGCWKRKGEATAMTGVTRIKSFLLSGPLKIVLFSRKKTKMGSPINGISIAT
jgi:hypothetical protein